MPLQKQEMDVQIAQGVETKGDPKKVIPGRLLSLQNGIFVSPGQIKKVNGFTPLSTARSDSGSVTAGVSMFTYGNKILIHNGDELLAYDEALASWGSVSATTHACGLTAPGATAVGVTGVPLIRYGLTQGHPDMTIHSSGHTVVAWENATAGGVYYSVIDTASGVNVVAGKQVANPLGITLRSPKVVSLGTYALIFCVGGSALYYAAVDMTAPASGTAAAVSVASDFNAGNKNYDVCVVGSTAVVTYAAAGGVDLNTLTSGLVWANRAVITGAATGSLTVFPHPTAGQVVVAWGDLTAGAQVTKYAIYGGVNYVTQITAPTTIESAGATGITGTIVSGTEVAFYYTIPSGNATLVSNYVVRTRVLNGASFLAAASDLARSVGLAGKAYTYNLRAFIPVVYDSTFQPTLFLLDQAGNVIAKALTDVAAGQPAGPTNITGTNLLPEHNLSGAIATFAMMEQVSVASSGIRSVMFTFGVKPTGAVLGAALHFGRGILNMYDGVSMVEHGFHVFPESPSVPNPGGANSYQYCHVFAWTDSQGNIHRSAPSIPVTQQQPSPIDAASNSVTVSCPTLRITRKPSGVGVQQVGGAPVEIEVYRTLNGGSVFYRCHAINQTPPFNDDTVDAVTFVDGLADSQIAANPQLYTTGGALEDYPSNPPLYVEAIRNRLWVVDETNPLTLWFSKEVAQGSPVELCGPGAGTLIFNLEAKGPAVAVASLDDKVIILRENSLGWISGDGPAADGSGFDFVEVPIPADVGCVDPGSVMTGGLGLTFKSNKGFYMLNRSMETSYVGSDVESFNGYAVTSATLLPKTNWAIFTLSNGSALLYDYLMTQWSTIPAVSAVDAGVYKGLHAFLSSAGVVYTETPGTFTANGAFMPILAETSWLKVSGVNGLQRIYKLLLLGEWKSSHKLRVDLCVNYDPTVIQSVTFDATNSQVPYQWRLEPLVQQCVALKVKLTEVQSGSPGEGLSLSAISLLVGFKPGLARIEAARTKG